MAQLGRMMMANRLAVVTGGATGIGEAIEGRGTLAD